MATSFTEFKRSEAAAGPHFAVIGNPVGHSLSPLMHQAALNFHGIEARYLAIELQHGEISDFISWINRDTFLGCNITIPYKGIFMDVVDEIDDNGRRANVINTIAKSDSRLIGHNTDIHGFKQPLEKYSGRIEGGRAIVFGTGGASKAVRIGLEELGLEEVIFVSRSPERVEPEENGLYTRVVGYSDWQPYSDESALIINTTPVGMSPDSGHSPVSGVDAALLEGKICYDLIYNPLQTKFLGQAEANGASTVNGLEMFIHQGNRSFEIWTGKTFPFDLIKDKLSKELEG